MNQPLKTFDIENQNNGTLNFTDSEEQNKKYLNTADVIEIKLLFCEKYWYWIAKGKYIWFLLM